MESLDRLIELDALRLHLREWTGERGPLLCLPDLPLTSASFEGLATSFAPSWRVLAVDPRGQGQSDRPTYGYAYPTVAADVASLVEQFGFEEMVLVGHGFGALHALLLAGWMSARVRLLVLLDGGAPLSARTREHPRGLGLARDGYEAAPPSARVIARAVRCPTLVVRATGGRSLLTPRSFQSLLRLLPVAEGLELAQSHDDLLLNPSVLLLETIRRFLDLGPHAGQNVS